MIDFKLDPSSGYADSYTDIQFVVKFTKSERSEIKLFNNTVDLELDILGVDTGYILGETTVITQKSDVVRGYINLFNKDKMNIRLTDYVSVDIRCKVTSIRQGEEFIEEQTVTFYNQSKSLDGSIVPFDIVVHNTKVDLVAGIPLKLSVVCNAAKKYELAIRSDDGMSMCTFEVYTKNGHVSIDLPSAVICFDLELSKNHYKRFQIYWVKFEGVTYQKTMNRKFMPIDNTELHFNAKSMMPKSQNKNGPLGLLSDNFVLSSRYFVHTWRRFSGFGQVVEGFGPRRMDYLTRFMHEAQNMQKVQSEVTASKQRNDETHEIRRAIRSDLMQKRVIRSFPSPKQKEFLKAFSGAYVHPIVDTKNLPPPSLTKQKKGGCGCTRNKQQA